MNPTVGIDDGELIASGPHPAGSDRVSITDRLPPNVFIDGGDIVDGRGATEPTPNMALQSLGPFKALNDA
jgi:hypothetical protein